MFAFQTRNQLNIEDRGELRLNLNFKANIEKLVNQRQDSHRISNINYKKLKFYIVFNHLFGYKI